MAEWQVGLEEDLTERDTFHPKNRLVLTRKRRKYNISCQTDIHIY